MNYFIITIITRRKWFYWSI